jgi:S-DNA-T family DNA segregation ATPase FtsK/SpoIIIE
LASKKNQPVKVTRVKRMTPQAQPDSKRNEIAGVCWIALGAFLFLCVVSPSASHWIGKAGFLLQQLLFGLFGMAAYVLPLALIVLGVACIAQRAQGISRGKLAACCVGAFFILCLLNMLFLKKANSEQYGVFLANTYLYGQTAHLGGGAFSALFVYPLKRLIGNAGANIFLCAGILICVLIVTNLSLKRTGQEVGNVVQQQVVEHRERNAQVHLYNERLERAHEADVSDPTILGPEDYKGGKRQKHRRDKRPRLPVGRVTDASDSMPQQEPAVQQDVPFVEAQIVSEPAPKRQTKTVGQEPVVFEGEQEEGGIPEDNIEQARIRAAAAPRRYQFPPVEYLSPPKPSQAKGGSLVEARAKAKRLEEILASFDVEARVVNISQGPSVTRYEVQPAAGVKLSRIVNLTDDIALGMASMGIRMEAPIPGKAAVGIELPNERTTLVTLREIIESDKFKNAPSNLTFALGRDVSGNVVVGDIAKMPHLLVAGATGMGKSVCIHSMLLSILYKSSPQQARLILIDPKKVEFSMYNGIGHLLIPVVTDPRKAAGALNWAVTEMERRYKLFSENGVNNMFRYNEKFKGDADVEQMYQIVIFIDELADLMMVASKEVENSIMRLAQMARAAGIYLVIATQRPSVDVVTGVIKANIPSRIALTVSSQVDSRTIIDSAGAERLLGNGDMLYSPTGMLKPLRVQGAFVQDADRDRVIEFVKAQGGPADYNEQVIDALEAQSDKQNKDAGTDTDAAAQDPLLSEAIDIVVESGQASISLIQRKLRVGYARAGHLIDTMEKMGVVGASEGSKPRRVLIDRQQWQTMAGEAWPNDPQ